MRNSGRQADSINILKRCWSSEKSHEGPEDWTDDVYRLVQRNSVLKLNIWVVLDENEDDFERTSEMTTAVRTA